MALVKLPKNVAYAWWTDGGKTHLERNSAFHVPRNKLIKLTAFDCKDEIHNNLGTALFSSTAAGTGTVKLRWLRNSNSVPSVRAFENHGTPFEVEGGQDRAPALWREMKDTTHLHRGASGFDRNIAVDWEWPFPVPGQNGIPELAIPVPGWREALPWYEWHAVGSMGKRSFAECSPGEKKSVVGIAVGAVGYLTGYNHEKVDDTSSQYCSMGTGNDCDDFAVAAGSLAHAAIHDTQPPCCAVHQWLRTNVKDVHVVSGFAWPNMLRDKLGRKKTVGHMWCELVLNDNSPLVVECTSGVAYYGGTPISKTVRAGDPREYVTREYYWNVDRSHHHQHELARRTVPKWFRSLSFSPPSPADDPDYVPPPAPPQPQFVYASVPSRQVNIGTARQIRQKVLPFTTGDVIFALEPVNLTNNHVHGSLQ